MPMLTEAAVELTTARYFAEELAELHHVRQANPDDPSKLNHVLVRLSRNRPHMERSRATLQRRLQTGECDDEVRRLLIDFALHGGDLLDLPLSHGARQTHLTFALKAAQQLHDVPA